MVEILQPRIGELRYPYEGMCHGSEDHCFRSLSCAAAGSNVVLILLLSRYLGAKGVALAYVGGVGVVCGLGGLVLGKKWKPYQRVMIHLVLKVTGAAIAAGSVLYGVSVQVSRLLGRQQGLSNFIVLLSSLMAAGAFGAVLLGVMLVVLRVEEATSLLKYLKRLWTLGLGCQAD